MENSVKELQMQLNRLKHDKEFLQSQVQELDDLVDYLIDKMGGDRVEFMRMFLKELNDE